ncbi:MAG: hypothetical protein EA377_14420 [Phycisphaerales bacterium]|nr:MAG: hypothetical protein EA377_14420 [Phycisphaerales bacterium]
MAETASGIQHERIMALAGSGKTFQLAHRYIALLREGASPETILATTFTRLAAGEIRDRILTVLAEAVQSPRMREEIESQTGRAITVEEARIHLRNVSRVLHRLQIRTLDSFLAGLVRCFAFELEVDPGATIIDDVTHQQLREEAIRLMLDERDAQPLVNLLRALSDENSSRSVTDQIHSTVSGLYEICRIAPPEAWGGMRPRAVLSGEELENEIAHFEHEIEDRLELGEAQYKKSILNALRGDVARVGTARSNRPRDWMQFLEKGLAAKILQGEEPLRYGRVLIPEELPPLYEQLIRHAQQAIWNLIVRQTAALHELMDRFDQRYREVKHRMKAMTFSDLQALLLTHESLGSLEEIGYRLDATLHHMLLDEMQDTSIGQWQILRPFVEELVSHAPPERSFFCVGDVKQSIYGWRAACPDILQDLPQHLYPDVPPAEWIRDGNLDKSYRSSPAILDIVNRTFRNLSGNPVLEGQEMITQVWDRDFRTHEAHHADRAGYVEVRIAPRAEKENGEDQNDVRLTNAAKLIRELHEHHPGRSIGVLVRSNRAVNQLLYRLGPSGENVPASGVGGGTLTDAPPINVILDLLTLADHPGHTAAAFNVARSPLGRVVGLNDHKAIRTRQRIAQDVRRRLVRDGYAATLRTWIRAITPHVDARQRNRLFQLEDLAVQYDPRATLRTDDFIRFVEAARLDDPAAANVQVMTVHQSKGLQFDVVVLPDLDQKFAPMRNIRLLVERDGAAGPIRRLVRNVSGEMTKLFPETSELLENERLAQVRDSLSVLYVAMTRARYAMHLVLNPNRADAQTILTSDMSGLLHAALLDPDQPREPETVPLTHGEPDWHERVDPPTVSDDAVGDEDPLLARPPALTTAATYPRGRSGRAASAQKAGRNALHDRIGAGAREARERGTAIHAMLEAIEWIDDEPPTTDELIQSVQGIARSKDQLHLRDQADWLRRRLREPQVRAVFRRRPKTDGRVLREFPYARLNERDEVVRGVIDRLVLHESSGRVNRAEIIDFKTDQIQTEQVKARAEIYRDQMAEYRLAIRSAFGLSNEQVQCSLLFIQPGCLETVPADN